MKIFRYAKTQSLDNQTSDPLYHYGRALCGDTETGLRCEETSYAAKQILLMRESYRIEASKFTTIKTGGKSSCTYIEIMCAERDTAGRISTLCFLAENEKLLASTKEDILGEIKEFAKKTGRTLHQNDLQTLERLLEQALPAIKKRSEKCCICKMASTAGEAIMQIINKLAQR